MSCIDLSDVSICMYVCVYDSLPTYLPTYLDRSNRHYAIGVTIGVTVIEISGVVGNWHVGRCVGR